MASPSFRSPRGRTPAMPSPLRRAAVAATVYVVVCVTYIVVSDRILERTLETRPDLAWVGMAKGVGFVVLTGALYFVISWGFWRRIVAQERVIREQQASLLDSERRAVAAMSTASIAHDVNNLLTVLGGLIDRLRSRGDRDAETSEMCDLLDSGFHRLASLAKRATSATRRVVHEERSDVDLDIAIPRLVHLIRQHPDVRRCRVDVGALPAVRLRLDATLFEDTLVNLLLNATQAAGPDGRVEIRVREDPGGGIRLEVHDDGPGVPPEDREHIFDACYTTKPGGSGLGLLAVRTFALSHDASIHVDRSPLGGAVFHLEFPPRLAVALVSA